MIISRICFLRSWLRAGVYVLFGFSAVMSMSLFDYHPGYAADFPAQRVSNSCNAPAPVDPTSTSLLVVLLDRSGSLIAAPSPTDPHGYSTSVTKALADLWPGRMAVIPFNGNTTTLPIWQSDSPADRTSLKDQVQNYPIGGATPLAPAMQEAQRLFQQDHTPAGSRMVIITDGNPTGDGTQSPTGADQEKLIRSSLITQFCQMGIPVSAFGLEINTTTPDGQDANRLLSDITTGTNALYTDVTSPEQLSSVVVQLYAQWQHLGFTKEHSQGGNFIATIDNQTLQASFVIFRSNSSYAVTLTDPNGQRVGPPLSTDAHYEIDALNTGGAPLAGNYRISVGGDPQAQVYKLVKTQIGLRLVAPTNQKKIYDNQSLTIQAEFLSSNAPLTPLKGQGQIVATITLKVNGQVAATNGSNIINLTQEENSAIFSGKTIIFGQAGQLVIELKGIYQQTQVETSSIINLLTPPLPPLPCPLSCQIDKNKAALLGGVAFALLLLLTAVVFLRRRRPKLTGFISNGKKGGSVLLDDLQVTHITNHDLDMHGSFQFGDAHFELRQRKQRAIIKTFKGSSTVQIDGEQAGTRLDVTPHGVEIGIGKKIYTDGKPTPAASYESQKDVVWPHGVIRERLWNARDSV